MSETPPGGQVYRSTQFQTGADVDAALNKALTAVQPEPQDGRQYARQDGAWVPAGVGKPGLSAYDIAVEQGFTGTESQWVASLEGESAYEVAQRLGLTGGLSERDWVRSLEGPPGASQAVLRTLYYEAAAGQQSFNLGTSDLNGRTLTLSTTYDNLSTMSVAVDGQIQRVGTIGDPDAVWRVDVGGNAVIFTSPLTGGELVTISAMVPVGGVVLPATGFEWVAFPADENAPGTNGQASFQGGFLAIYHEPSGGWLYFAGGTVSPI
jgi:hypothetical protein